MAYKELTKTIQGAHGETISIHFRVDAEGRPAGGYASGMGMSVTFQDGPIGEGGRNGAFVEDLPL